MFRKYLYISLLIVSIIGLSIVQFQYFRIGLNLAGVKFNERMGEAIVRIKKDLSEPNQLSYLMATTMTGQASNFNLPLDSITDAATYFLDDYLKAQLLEQGIKARFTYELKDAESKVYLESEEQFEKDQEDLVFPIILEGYLPETTSKGLSLTLRFRNINRYFLSQLDGLIIPSLIFIVIIVSILIWVFRAFYLQKNLIISTNEFINNLTHELKTPTFSMGVATKILEEKVQGDGKEVIQVLRTQLNKLKGQIDKVLELSLIENKRGFIKREPFDLLPLLNRIDHEYTQLMELEGADYSSEIDQKNYAIKGDEDHLENAINSLLENARKYSRDKVKINFDVRSVGNKVEIKISDQGIGIDPVDQKNIFRKYYRVSNGDRHDVKGYGLGLHYVKKIVTLHKGSISVNSQKGSGSEFIISLPLDH